MLFFFVKSKEFHIQNQNESTNTFSILSDKHKEIEQLVEINDNFENYSCGQNIIYGYPCAHILCVLITLKLNIPYTNLIHRHWIINNQLPVFNIDSTSLINLNNFDLNKY